jgi:hypothetical protein
MLFSARRGALRAALVLLAACATRPAQGYQYAKAQLFGDEACTVSNGELAMVDSYCTATSRTTSLRLCCKGTEARFMYYDSTPNCVGVHSIKESDWNHGLDYRTRLDRTLRKNECSHLQLLNLISSASCSKAPEVYVLRSQNTTEGGTTRNEASGHCTWNSATRSTRRTCTALHAIRIETFGTPDCSGAEVLPAAIVRAPHREGDNWGSPATGYTLDTLLPDHMDHGGITWSCEPFTHIELSECRESTVVSLVPQGWGPSAFSDFVPQTMIGSDAQATPSLQYNKHKRGGMFAKLTEPSENDSPTPYYIRNECEDNMPPAMCWEWKTRYGCDSAYVGGKGERESKPMTIGEACPSACNPNCTQIPYRDLGPSTLRNYGFDMFTDESGYPNPDA